MQNARMQVLRTMNVFHAVFHGRKNEVSLRVNGLDVKEGAVLTGFALGAYLPSGFDYKDSFFCLDCIDLFD